MSFEYAIGTTMPVGTITIRPFAAADQDMTKRLILAGLADHFGQLDETMNPDLNDIARTYLQAGSLFVVAEIEGDIIGCGGLVTETPGTARLVRMSVSRQHRGRGIGRALVCHLLSAARARGDKRAVVETNDDWADAIGLYLARGFQEYDRREGEVHLALDLKSATD